MYRRECAVCHGPDRSGTQNGPSLLDVPGRLDAATVRSTVVTGKGRMPAFPHIDDVELETLATYLVTPAFGGLGGRGRGGANQSFPPGPVVGSGGAQVRAVPAGGRGRGGPRPYPEGVEQTPQYVINAYGTIGVDDEAAVHQAIALRPQHRPRSSGRWASETTPGWRRSASPALV